MIVLHQEGTTHLHWVKGSGNLFDIRGVDLNAVKDKGFKRIRFLKNIRQPPPINPTDDWSFKVLNNKVGTQRSLICILR